MTMLANELRQRVQITKMTRVFDGRGGWIERESEVGTFWAALFPLGIGERVTYSQLDVNVTMKVYMRHNRSIDNNCFLYFQGKKYDVKGVLNPAFRNELMELVVGEV